MPKLFSSYSLNGFTKIRCGEYLLFYKPLKIARSGFSFLCFEWVGGTSYGPHDKQIAYPDRWDDPGSEVKRIIEGVAYFDGLRHLIVGERDGHLNYPDSVSLGTAFTELSKLEKELCWGCNQNEPVL